jgi:flagellar motor switch protein FliG
MSLDLPMPDMPADPPSSGGAGQLTPKEKAAIVVRLLLSQGAVPALSSLPESKQTELAVQLARMAPVESSVVAAVAQEFADAIGRIGLSFPTGIDGALGLLDGVISASASCRLRRMSPSEYQGDPWEQIGAVDADRLVPFLENEAVEVAAVILGKLKVSKSAELLERLPGERARRITYAVSLTGGVSPAVVHRIGVSLAEQLNTRPARAFSDGPVERVGAILNFAPASVRDDVLTGLDSEDAGFAEQVRRAIFTFSNIPERVAPRDVPRIQRDMDQGDLITTIAFASDGDAKAVDFLLENISQRLAENLRSEAAEKTGVAQKDGEAAMMRIVNIIRELESAGEIFLVAEDG